MKSKLIITLTALLMLGGISAMAQGSFPKGDINEDGVVNAADIVALANIIMNGEEPSGGTKYYWYAGTTLPTANNIASIALGSSNTIEKWDGKEFSITNSGEEATPAYVCTPVDFKVSWKDTNGFTLNLVEVDGARFTLNGIKYKVQKRGRDLSAGAIITFRGYYDETITSNDYYIYIGLNRPTSSTDPETDLAADNTPLYEGYGAAGWRNIGSDISIYNASNPAYNGGANTVILDKEFNNVLCYVAIPVGMGIYDGLGNPSAWTLDQSDITIKGNQYNVYKAKLEGECGNSIYCSTGGDMYGETKYYWYAGTTIPTAENISTIATGSETSKPDWSEPQSIKATNNTGESAYLYYCFPTDWNIKVLDSDKTTEMSLAQEETFTYGGISYTVQRTGRQISNGSSKDFYATTTSGEAKYYWYAGTTLPTADNIASIALGSSNTIEQWDGKEFSIINSGEESTPAYVCTPVDFKVSWKDMNGFTLNLVEVEGAGFTLNGIEYKVQKKGRDLSAGAELTCLGYYTDYWYVGNVEPTAATNPVTESGWTALYSKPEQIQIFKEDSEFNDVQWYLAAPAEWGFETTVNGIQVGGWTKTTITINHVSYNVWTAQSLTDTVNVTLANIDN